MKRLVQNPCTICGKPARGEAFVLGVGMSPLCADCRSKGTVVVAPGDPLGRENKQAYAAHLKKLAVAYGVKKPKGDVMRRDDDIELALDKGRAEGLNQAAELLLNGLPADAVEARQLPAKDDVHTANAKALFPENARLGAGSRRKRTPLSVSPMLAPRVSPRESREPHAPREPSETTPKPRLLTGDDVTLLAGELRILAAIAQSPKGRSTDELTAMVDYRATSLRTYLGNLRMAGYVETHRNHHTATKSGAERAANAPRMAVGTALLKEAYGRLLAGEAKILRIIAEGPTDLNTLVGDATGLKMTSVRTYAGSLVQRRLVERTGRGELSLARIVSRRAK